MSTIRVGRRRRFTQIDRRTVADNRLSFKALGLLTWLLDKPDDWETSSEALARLGRKEGRDAIRAAMRELQDAGYLAIARERVELGRFNTVITVYERPVDEVPPETGFPAPVEALTGDGLSGAGSAGAGKPGRKRETDLPETEKPPYPPSSATADGAGEAGHSPQPPAERGAESPTRASGQNPRARGTNPRGPKPPAPVVGPVTVDRFDRAAANLDGPVGDAHRGAAAARARLARRPAVGE